MDLRAYLTALRRNWLLLAVPVVLGVIVAVLALQAQTPKYQSTAKVIVSVGNTANANDLSQANSFAQSAAANFAALAEQPYVLHAVRKELKLPLSSEDIADEMTTSVEQNTSIIAIDVLDPSATRAAAIANATSRQLSTAVSVLNPPAADGTQNVRVTVVRTAGVPQEAITPNRPMGLALGLLGGLLLGVVLVILRELLDTRIRSVDDLQELAGAPVVGRIPQTASIADRPLVMADGSAAAEGFRLLQLNTEYLRAPHGVVVLGVTSAVPSEGKSTVAANLALALASAGHRVALVDADLRRPRLHTLFGLDAGLGLTEVLVGRADVLDVVQAWGTDESTIAVVPAGATPPNPGELLQSPRLRAALDRLAEEADVVVVDGPPLLAVADSAVLASTVDAVLLVASLQRSHTGSVGRAVDALHGVGAKVLGVVATMTRAAKADAEAYGSYSGGRAADAGPASGSLSTVLPWISSRAAALSASLAAARTAGRRDGAAPGPQGSVGRVVRVGGAARATPAGSATEDGGHLGVQQVETAERVQQSERAVPAEQVEPTEHAEQTSPEERIEPAEPAERAEAGVPAEAAEAPEAGAASIDEAPVEGSETDRTPPTARRTARSAPTARRATRGSRPTRVPSPDEVDAKTMRSARRTMSADEVRIIRSATQDRRKPDAG